MHRRDKVGRGAADVGGSAHVAVLVCAAPGDRGAAAGKGIGIVQPGNHLIGHGGKFVGWHVEDVGERTQRVDGVQPFVGVGELVAGNRLGHLKVPGGVVGIGFDPAFEAATAAEIDARLALSVLGVRDNHQAEDAAPV